MNSQFAQPYHVYRIALDQAESKHEIARPGIYFRMLSASNANQVLTVWYDHQGHDDGIRHQIGQGTAHGPQRAGSSTAHWAMSR